MSSKFLTEILTRWNTCTQPRSASVYQHNSKWYIKLDFFDLDEPATPENTSATHNSYSFKVMPKTDIDYKVDGLIYRTMFQPLFEAVESNPDIQLTANTYFKLTFETLEHVKKMQLFLENILQRTQYLYTTYAQLHEIRFPTIDFEINSCTMSTLTTGVDPYDVISPNLEDRFIELVTDLGTQAPEILKACYYNYRRDLFFSEGESSQQEADKNAEMLFKAIMDSQDIHSEAMLDLSAGFLLHIIEGVGNATELGIFSLKNLYAVDLPVGDPVGGFDITKANPYELTNLSFYLNENHSASGVNLRSRSLHMAWSLALIEAADLTDICKISDEGALLLYLALLPENQSIERLNQKFMFPLILLHALKRAEADSDMYTLVWFLLAKASGLTKKRMTENITRYAPLISKKHIRTNLADYKKVAKIVDAIEETSIQLLKDYTWRADLEHLENMMFKMMEIDQLNIAELPDIVYNTLQIIAGTFEEDELELKSTLKLIAETIKEMMVDERKKKHDRDDSNQR